MSVNSWIKLSLSNEVQNLFIKAIDFLNTSNGAKSSDVSTPLKSAFEKAKTETYDALCDSFNTRPVMQAMSDLVSAFNILDKVSLNPAEVRPVAEWLTFMVNMLGLNGPTSADSKAIGWAGSSIPDAAKHYVYPLSKVRDELRRKARSSTGISLQDLSNESVSSLPSHAAESASRPYAQIVYNFTASIKSLSSSASFPESKSQPVVADLSKSILKLCDHLRDVDLWDQGIYLEDSNAPDEPAVVRPVTRELLAARREREEREHAKQKAREGREREAIAKAEKGKLSHLEMFRTSEYSAWDDEGLPLKDSEGKELPKSRTKKLKKDWERQKRVHEAWLSSQAN